MRCRERASLRLQRVRGGAYLPAMRWLVLILAIMGALAVLIRIARALLRLLHRGVDAFLAQEVARVRAQRGDITGMSDAERMRSLARRRRLLAVAGLSFWVVLLVAPPLTPWPAALYALYSVLWFVPHERRPA